MQEPRCWEGGHLPLRSEVRPEKTSRGGKTVSPKLQSSCPADMFPSASHLGVLDTWDNIQVMPEQGRKLAGRAQGLHSEATVPKSHR